MVKQTIKIFVRIKPTKPTKTGLYETDEDEEGFPRLTVTVPRELASGFINNKKETYKFRFDKCFDQTTPQDEVFQHVAKPVIDNVLQGYNGTIFAYGQTGSGKTFTITGGAERYIDRGIIPRSLSYLFSKTENNPDLTFTVHISYLEIYNEHGYDLLDPKHEAAKLEDLPKVSLMEDSDQNIHLKNLSVHQAASEEEALNLLFLGDTNRMIAETPMNQASSRSHCIFTVHVTAREAGSATIKRAKLHLVDLAGSERVSKTGVNGVLLTEAKYINLSLHYLEQVIIALSERNRQHVPYRNSMMTSVLRDSLGGNCMTTMIATCSMEKGNVDESISTCRFSQRVAMIKNDVMLNEELDPKLLILKLKRDNQELREQLAMATGEQLSDELTSDELQRCEEAVRRYLEETDADSYLSVGHDLRRIQLCFRILKRYVLERPAAPQQPMTPPRPESPTDVGPYSKTENKRLKDLLLQRDNEINILVNMLKKEKKRAADAEAGRGGSHSARRSSETNGHAALRSDSSMERRAVARPSSESQLNQSGQRTSGMVDKDERMKTKILGQMSLGRQEAFDVFMRDYHQSQDIEENKLVLKQRYGQAKKLGEKLNTAKQKINHFKGELEELRLQGGYSEGDMEEMEQGLRQDMEREKMIYKETFMHLRTMKTEIEHLQHLLEKSKVKMMKDFEIWWAQQTNAAQPQASEQQAGVRSAWNTPPITPTVNGSTNDQRNYTQEVVLRSGGDIADRPPQRPVSSSRHGRGMAANFAGSRPSDREGTYTLNSVKTSGGGGRGASDIPLTGDPQADADIMAFIRARQNILQQAQGNR